MAFIEPMHCTHLYKTYHTLSMVSIFLQTQKFGLSLRTGDVVYFTSRTPVYLLSFIFLWGSVLPHGKLHVTFYVKYVRSSAVKFW